LPIIKGSLYLTFLLSSFFFDLGFSNPTNER
jgi:hypothetical protein